MCDWQVKRLWTLMNVIVFIEILLSHPLELINVSPRIIVSRLGSRVIAHVRHRKPVCQWYLKALHRAGALGQIVYYIVRVIPYRRTESRDPHA